MNNIKVPKNTAIVPSNTKLNKIRHERRNPHRPIIIPSMNFPSDLKYTRNNEWIKIEGNVAYIGITDFAQSELGDIVYVDVNTDVKTINKEEVFGRVESVKSVSDLFLPISGTILEVNTDLETSPDKVNSDPYGGGWIIKMEISNLSEIDALLDAAGYTALIG